VNKAVAEMDKVVQQTAASAEESASASEQMSAQAEQMKTVVGELVNLVGRSKGRAEDRQQIGADIGETGGLRNALTSHKAIPAPAKGKEVASHQKKHVSPDVVIPMDEGEFKDF